MTREEFRDAIHSAILARVTEGRPTRIEIPAGEGPHADRIVRAAAWGPRQVYATLAPVWIAEPEDGHLRHADISLEPDDEHPHKVYLGLPSIFDADLDIDLGIMDLGEPDLTPWAVDHAPNSAAVWLESGAWVDNFKQADPTSWKLAR